MTDVIAALRDYMEANEQRVSSIESIVSTLSNDVSGLSTKVADAESKIIRCESGEDVSPTFKNFNDQLSNIITFARSFKKPPTVITSPRKVVDDKAMLPIWSNTY